MEAWASVAGSSSVQSHHDFCCSMGISPGDLCSQGTLTMATAGAHSMSSESANESLQMARCRRAGRSDSLLEGEPGVQAAWSDGLRMTHFGHAAQNGRWLQPRGQNW